jgi:hypothetical protein
MFVSDIFVQRCFFIELKELVKLLANISNGIYHHLQIKLKIFIEKYSSLILDDCTDKITTNTFFESILILSSYSVVIVF